MTLFSVLTWVFFTFVVAAFDNPMVQRSAIRSHLYYLEFLFPELNTIGHNSIHRFLIALPLHAMWTIDRSSRQNFCKKMKLPGVSFSNSAMLIFARPLLNLNLLKILKNSWALLRPHPPKFPWQHRHPKSAGSIQTNVSAFNARAALIRAHSYPKDQPERILIPFEPLFLLHAEQSYQGLDARKTEATHMTMRAVLQLEVLSRVCTCGHASGSCT